MELLKRQMLEEIGTYIQSSTEIVNSQLTKDTITTFTAGILQLELIDEKWDGVTYWLKATISVDTSDVVLQIQNFLKNKELSQQVIKLELINNTLFKENADLRDKVKGASSANTSEVQTIYNKNITRLRSNKLVAEGNIHFSQNGDKAISLYDKAIELDPQNTEAHRMRATVYRLKKKYGLAEESLNQLVAKYPKDKMLLVERALLLRDMGKNTEALSELDHAKAIKGNSSDSDLSSDSIGSTVYYMAGDIYHHTIKNYKNALKEYSNAITIDPKNANAYFARSEVYIKIEDDIKAIEDAKMVIILTKRDDLINTLAHENIGNAYINLGRDAIKKQNIPEAKKWFIQAIRLGRVDAIGQSNLIYRGFDKNSLSISREWMSVLTIAAIYGDIKAMALLPGSHLVLKNYEESVSWLVKVKNHSQYKKVQGIQKIMESVESSLRNEVGEEKLQQMMLTAKASVKEEGSKTISTEMIECTVTLLNKGFDEYYQCFEGLKH